MRHPRGIGSQSHSGGEPCRLSVGPPVLDKRSQGLDDTYPVANNVSLVFKSVSMLYLV